MRKYQGRDNIIVNLWNSGEYTLDSIGKIYNVSKERIRQIVKEINTIPPKDRIDHRDIKRSREVNSLRDNGYSMSEISERLNLSRVVVRKFFAPKDREWYYKRFISHIYKDEISGCWIYGNRYTREQVNINHHYIYIYRLVWEYLHGVVPNGLCICHKCDNKSCINPDHLFVGTVADNVKDRDEKGRGAHQAKIEKHCKKCGEIFTGNYMKTYCDNCNSKHHGKRKYPK